MDPLYTEGGTETSINPPVVHSPLTPPVELMNPHNDFHHQQYAKVIAVDPASVSPEAALPLRILQLRARIATGDAPTVLTELGAGDGALPPALAAVRALALHAIGDADAAISEAERLADAAGDDGTVQVLAGTVLQAGGKSDAALALLGRHQNNLEAAALTVQIHLVNNRTERAAREVRGARQWAQDALLVNLAEAWLGLRVGGDRYQQAFYEFEDMPVPQAVAELHLGRLPEAEAALGQARREGPGHAAALANAAVLEALAGRETGELLAELRGTAPKHPLVVDLREKEDLFEQAAAKYSPKVAA